MEEKDFDVADGQSEELNEIEKVEEKLISSIEYDVTNAEEKIAFVKYQKKYVYKKCIIQTIIFAILALLFLQQVVLEPSRAMSWSLMSICLAMIFVTWFNQFKIRKTLLENLKQIENDRYRLNLYETYFSIETIQFGKDEDQEIEQEIISDENDDDEIEEKVITPQDIKPRIIKISEDNLFVTETDELFIVFIKNQTIFVVPKRCADGYFISVFSQNVQEKLGENYKVEK